MIDDKSELDKRIGKLRHFMATTDFDEVDHEEKVLLTKQFDIMVDYSDILRQQIALFEGDKEQ
jgi:hypothetical protein